MTMRRQQLLALLLAVTATAACAPRAPAPAPSQQGALRGLAAQRVVVTPAFALETATDLGWSPTPRQSETLRALDDDIVSAFGERGLKDAWVFTDALVASHKRNPTYAADPYRLGVQPLRSPVLKIGDRLPEPLASQLRTIVALNDGRYVLAPVELRIERVGEAPSGHGVLRIVLLDARASEVKWIGRVEGESATSFGPALTASVAERLADLVTAP